MPTIAGNQLTMGGPLINIPAPHLPVHQQVHVQAYPHPVDPMVENQAIDPGHLAHVQPYRPPANPVVHNYALDPALVSMEQSRNPERGRSLAQPMGKNWVQKRQDVIKEDTALKLLKTIRQENDEKKKRTCEIRLWFQVEAIYNASLGMNAHASPYIEWRKAIKSYPLCRNLS
jgi:hypothetical protein